ncbi:alpha/beta hydrolase [Kribbella albertanoniae]|uniref:Alpha/beta hydrolase n=1 Tax=Kribbella albertanoniae TaxID=1266829 RepID=A0A4R4Q9P0_9ACTN|nr:alpha/beta hydrolase [Kribbella albertanoniae]TDC31997.1 alpha/beta hydrolase [Kribbella albertanoniae]
MSSRTAVVVPGGQNGPSAPLPMYAADAAEQRGAQIHRIWWDEPDRPLTLTEAERGPWVVPQVERALSVTDGEVLLIGRSLGSYASPLVADRGLPAVWLSPILTDPWVVDGLRRATAPFLVVGGTADALWDSAVARELTPYVLEVPEASHGMYVPGRLAASAAVLGQVATAVEDFLDEVVWP